MKIKLIEQIWCDNFKIYGYPRIAIVLRKQEIKIPNGRVSRLIRRIHLRSLMNQRFHKPGSCRLHTMS